MLDVTHPDDVSETETKVGRLNPLKSVSMTKRYVRKDGSIMWARLTFKAFPNNFGDFNGIAVIEDISGQREAEDKVELRTKQLDYERARSVHGAKLMALGEMAGGIAHEINNPLTIIHMNAGLLKDLFNENIDREAGVKIADKIMATAERIAKIIRGLRSISRSGDQDPFETLTIGQLIEQTLGICGEKFKVHDVKVEVESDNLKEELECRQVQLIQVLLNFLNNSYDAIEHLPERWVRIETKIIGIDLSISVTDSGGACPRAFAKKFASPFLRLKSPVKERG